MIGFLQVHFLHPMRVICVSLVGVLAWVWMMYYAWPRKKLSLATKQLQLAGWKRTREVKVGAVRRIYWADPRDGQEFTQKQALKIVRAFNKTL